LSGCFEAAHLIALAGSSERSLSSLFVAYSGADHAQYLATWPDVLKADTKGISAAASKALQAAEFPAGLQGE
jgi:antirestriction protein ArdC